MILNYKFLICSLQKNCWGTHARIIPDRNIFFRINNHCTANRSRTIICFRNFFSGNAVYMFNSVVHSIRTLPFGIQSYILNDIGSRNKFSCQCFICIPTKELIAAILFRCNVLWCIKNSSLRNSHSINRRTSICDKRHRILRSIPLGINLNIMGRHGTTPIHFLIKGRRGIPTTKYIIRIDIIRR